MHIEHDEDRTLRAIAVRGKLGECPHGDIMLVVPCDFIRGSVREGVTCLEFTTPEGLHFLATQCDIVGRECGEQIRKLPAQDYTLRMARNDFETHSRKRDDWGIVDEYDTFNTLRSRK